VPTVIELIGLFDHPMMLVIAGVLCSLKNTHEWRSHEESAFARC